MKIGMFRIGLIVTAVVIFSGFYAAMRSKPELVDTEIVASGPMQVTITEQGVARVKNVYTVSSPIAGHLDRTTLDNGASVAANETVIASIHPPDPPFLDERALAEQTAVAQAARSAVALAQVEHTLAEQSLKLAQSDYRRSVQLAKTNVLSERALEQADNALMLQQAQVARTKAFIDLRNAELTSALERLRQPSNLPSVSRDPECCIRLTSPVDGVVLRVLARSEQAISQGTPIMEIGDPAKLEIVVDLLSTDAPQIRPGSRAIISDWGGDADLTATVRRIDPAAFTEVSSLGIEEQRVNAVLDMESVQPDLGHGYHVLVRLVVWSAPDVLQAPIGALFRSDGNWAVFVVEGGQATLREVEIDQINDTSVRINGGLIAGETVILYPNDILRHGTPVTLR